MKTINSQEVPFYPSLINDYISGELKRKSIINWDYSESQILENAKNRNFSSSERSILVKALRSQYESVGLSDEEESSLKLLELDTTLTITTGHQLNLLGGSQFFYTKILDVIRLAEKLTSNSTFNFVPVFWMATEDHDYEEISSVNLFGKKISCEGANEGPVGRIPSEYFNEFLEEVETVLGDNDKFAEIKKLISDSFTNSSTLAEITRNFVKALFGSKGLLIIDGDDVLLKKMVSDSFINEANNNTSFHSVNSQIEKMSGYKIQVSPREVNLFYIEDKVRDRIINSEDGFTTVNGLRSWTKSEFEFFIKDSPEYISPNVLLRPLYQEKVLPNVAYMGGAGEISYWLELAPMFKAFNVQFPLPIVRTSYFVMPEKQQNWLSNQGIEFADLFGNTDQLINNLIKKIGSEEISLETEKAELSLFYKSLLSKGKTISPDLEKVILGEEKRALSSLLNVEKRFSNAEKKKHEQTITKLKNIISKAFPGGSPMERVDSFIPSIVNEDFTFPTADDLFKGEIIVVS